MLELEIWLEDTEIKRPCLASMFRIIQDVLGVCGSWFDSLRKSKARFLWFIFNLFSWNHKMIPSSAMMCMAQGEGPQKTKDNKLLSCWPRVPWESLNNPSLLSANGHHSSIVEDNTYTAHWTQKRQSGAYVNFYWEKGENLSVLIHPGFV